jgi:hypothetical protein
MAGKPSPWLNYLIRRALIKLRSPGEAAAKPGLLGLGPGVKRDDPHRVSVLQLRRQQRVLDITVQRKTREP